jgi:hypothetical protein
VGLVDESHSPNRALDLDQSRHRIILPFRDLFEHLKSFQPSFIDRQSKARDVVIKIDGPTFRAGFTAENVPEQFIAHFYVDSRKVLRHWGIQAGHHHVIVMHLPRMRDYRH